MGARAIHEADLRPYFIYGALAIVWVALFIVLNTQFSVLSGALLLVAGLFTVVIFVIKKSRLQRGCTQSVLQVIHITELYWYLRQVLQRQRLS